jgi:hypothetical protein
MKCAGWSDQEIRNWYLKMIQNHGWAVIAVAEGEAEAAFAYTIGLTRFHGHPELLISGMHASDAQAVLNELGAEVRRGTRFTAAHVLRQTGRHRLKFMKVNDPGRLIEAQKMYASQNGPVPALQVVYSDHDGHWPWDRAWRNGEKVQPLFGTPSRRQG